MGSSGDASRTFPFRRCVKAVNMGGRGVAAGTGWNEEVADSRKDTGEPLQAS
jgi:hypothetical protein